MEGRYAAIAAARAAIPGLLGDDAQALAGVRAVIDDMRDRHGDDGVAALVVSLAYPYALHAVGMFDPDSARRALEVFNLPEPQRRPRADYSDRYSDLPGALHAALDAYTQATLTAEDEALRGPS